MQLEINENPLSNEGGKDKLEEKEMIKNYIEVVPSLPTYHIEDIEVTRVLKYLFEPDTPRTKKMVIEYSMGFSHLIENDINSFDFSCLSFAPDTMPAHEAVELFINCGFDIEFTEKRLAIWGIKKVYIEPDPDKTATVHNLLEGIDRALAEETPSHTMVMCDDGEVADGSYVFGIYKTDKLIEYYKEIKNN